MNLFNCIILCIILIMFLAAKNFAKLTGNFNNANTFNNFNETSKSSSKSFWTLKILESFQLKSTDFLDGRCRYPAMWGGRFVLCQFL